jgi:hypothetical protein
VVRWQQVQVPQVQVPREAMFLEARLERKEVAHSDTVLFNMEWAGGYLHRPSGALQLQGLQGWVRETSTLWGTA